MSFLSKLGDVFSGGLASTVIDAVEKYFPPDMTPQQKMDLQKEMSQLELEKSKEVNKAIAEAESAINDRIAQYEGTAKDLAQMPVIGRIVLFARGCQRPLWGFATMYCDFMWFSGEWPTMTDQQQSALWVINLLVLGFLFGERAVKNVTPLIGQYFGKK